MSSLLIGNPNPSLSTSGSGAMRFSVNHQRTFVVAVPVFPALPRTTANESVNQDSLRVLARTTSGSSLSFHPTHSTETNRIALNELRILSGLTWEQLAKLFNVSRRSLHFWASGQPLSRSNEEKLNRFLGTIQYIDRGSASLNRSLLMQSSSDGSLLIDLLVAGQHEEVKRTLGHGNTPERTKLGLLSEEERRLRMPLPPDVLANPLPDISYRQTGRSRPARAARSRRDNSGQ
jgi:transcriptional regulator with XRE-family HTH domain